jgi:two-component system response regulator DctR
MQPVLNGMVFIVDDDAGVRDALAWLLRSRRLPSEVFASGEAFEALLARPAEGLVPASPAACCWTCACPA